MILFKAGTTFDMNLAPDSLLVSEDGISKPYDAAYSFPLLKLKLPVWSIDNCLALVNRVLYGSFDILVFMLEIWNAWYEYPEQHNMQSTVRTTANVMFKAR